MATVTMYDDVDVSLLPPGAPAYAGYVNGNWPNADEIARKFPKAKVIRISISATSNAGDCLDVESGDATNESAPGWVKLRLGHTATPKPWVYTSASNVANLLASLGKGGISRDKVFVWSAHYTNRPHICSPAECGYPRADGTQWTDKALGRNLDASVISDYMLPGYKAPAGAPAVDPAIAAAVHQINLAARKVPWHSRVWYKLRAAALFLLGKR